MGLPDAEITVFDAALRYARAGYHVFPATWAIGAGCSCRRSDCSSPAKHPLTLRGFLDATTDAAKITEWWSRWPQANVGIATEASSLVVMDVDPRHGGDASLDVLSAQYGRLETLEVLTGGGGQQFYFQASPTNPVQSRATALGERFPGIDVRGSGGYVIAPPSLHVSGRRYAWEVSSPSKAAPLPAWLLTMLATTSRKPITGADDDAIIIAGERNAALARFAGRLRRFGTGVDAITDALLAMNARQVRPPLDEREVRQIAASISRYAPTEVPGEPPVTTRVVPVQVVDVASVPDTDDSDLRAYSTGIQNIDAGMGPMRAGGFTVIGARQGHGKTSLLETIIITNAPRYKVLFATLEMTIEDVRDRMIARMMRVSLDDLDKMRRYREPGYKNGKDLIEGLKLKFYRPRERRLRTAGAIMDAAVQYEADILAVDYTRCIAGWAPGSEAGTIVEQFSQFSKDSRIHVALVSQMNRDAEGKRPIVSQLQDTGRLEQEAEKVLLLHRPFLGDRRNDTVAEVVVAKNRRGNVFRSHVHWLGSTTSFFSMTQDEERMVLCCQNRKK